MSTRRPRVKAAAILKPRRPLNANESNADKANHINKKVTADETPTTNRPPDDSTKSCDAADAADGRLEKVSPVSQPLSNENQPESKVSVCKIEENAADSSASIETKPSIAAAAAAATDASASKSPPKSSPSFRRISAPPVNIVNRRRSIIENCASPKFIRSPSYSFVSQLKPNASPHHGGSAAVKSVGGSTANHCDDEVFSPGSATANATSAAAAAADNDECFKSPPFMSPIYTPRRNEPSMSPFHDIYGEDCTKSPSQLPNNSTSNSSSSSNAKLRQRIRPTPCFANRRNSIQGNSLSALSVGSGGGGGGNGLGASESEDEQYRRQRHYSTSSNHSAYNPASTPQHQRNYFGLNKLPQRVRTESYSSSISDMPFSKAKRSHRSEEYQRVANAKREFNQRLNGKPPDKTRLTMYDLIYYNPLTNPMSKPAGKGGADGKNGDSASMASAKTNQSRESMKSEASVKSERSDSYAMRKAIAAANAGAATAAASTAAAATTATANGPVPQLKLDVNGEIILDEKSLVIETTANKEAREQLASSDVVYDDEFSGTSGFYKRQKRTRDWLPLETLKFYRSLQTIGTDFSVMLQLFPNRSRRDLKLKFKKEEKHNMALINKALLHPKEFNVDELKLQFDKEDEEIEQKKQEWAEVRKKMATERREQLNASKKRNPNKQISRSMRSLTDGDILYENEFVVLPPKTRRNRKRNVVQPDDSVFSPPSLNHNNNHVDTLPQHTYATHKLPNFLDMIAAQHKTTTTPAPNPHPIQTDQEQSNSIPSASPCPSPTNSNQIAPINYTVHTSHPSPSPSQHKYLNIESNGDGAHHRFDDTEPVSYDDESMHAMDLSTTAATATTIANTVIAAAAHSPIIIHGKHTSHHSESQAAVQHPPHNTGNKVDVDVVVDDDDVVVRSSVDESIQIGQYIAKNPNLTFKGTGDIMNMDIIFENVSIEEDTSIGAHSTNTASTTTTTSDINCSIESAADDDSRADDENVEVTQQIEHVNINGVHYQIITIENETMSDADVANITPFVDVAADEEVEAVVDNSTISVITRPDQREHEIDDATTATMMVMSNLDVAAEVEMAGDDEVPDEATVIATVPDSTAPTVKSESNDVILPISAVVDANDDRVAHTQPTKATPFQQHTESNTATDRRKRKQKVVPVLANSKRTRRNQTNNELEQPPTLPSSPPPPPPPIEPMQIDEKIVPSKLKFEPDVVQQPPIDIHESSELIETITDQTSEYAFQSEQESEQTFDDTEEQQEEEEEQEQEQCHDDDGDDDDDDDDDAVPERSFLDSLVVVESQDPNAPNRTIHEVFVVDPDTNEMSEKPLDLPDHVIQRIRLAIS